MVDIEFVAQYLQLRDAADDRRVLHQNTRAALAALAAAGALPQAAADALLASLALWRDLESLAKLTIEEPFDETAAMPARKALLAEGAGAVDFDALATKMAHAAAEALLWYDRLVAAPAAEARARLGEPAPHPLAGEEHAS